MAFDCEVHLFPVPKLQHLPDGWVGIDGIAVHGHDLVTRLQTRLRGRQVGLHGLNDRRLVRRHADIANPVATLGLWRYGQVQSMAVAYHFQGKGLVRRCQDLWHKVFPLGIRNAVNAHNEVARL